MDKACNMHEGDRKCIQDFLSAWLVCVNIAYAYYETESDFYAFRLTVLVTAGNL